jgi:hypothetical protein
VVIVINNSDKQVGLYSGGLIFGGGGAYIWNEVSISTCGALIHGGGAYIRRFTVCRIICMPMQNVSSLRPKL